MSHQNKIFKIISWSWINAKWISFFIRFYSDMKYQYQYEFLSNLFYFLCKHYIAIIDWMQNTTNIAKYQCDLKSCIDLHFCAYHNTLRLETNIFFSLPSNNLRIIMGVYCLFIICKYEFVSFLAPQDTENGRVEVWSKLPITVKLMENNCIGCLVK